MDVFFSAKIAALDANGFAIGFIHREAPTTASFSCSPEEPQGAAEGSGAGKIKSGFQKAAAVVLLNLLSACCFREGFSNMIHPPFCINKLFSHWKN